MEEDLWAQEALVADVDGELPLGDGVDARVLLDPSGSIRVVLVKLLHQVGTHVAEALLSRKKREHVEKEGGGTKERRAEARSDKPVVVRLNL